MRWQRRSLTRMEKFVRLSFKTSTLRFLETLFLIILSELSHATGNSSLWILYFFGAFNFFLKAVKWNGHSWWLKSLRYTWPVFWVFFFAYY